MRAGTSERCAPAVLSLPPLRGGPLTVHEATGGYVVRSPCPSGIPRPRHNASLPWAGGIAPDLTSALAAIVNSGSEIENRCTVCPCFDLLAASIRKFGLEIKNRCTISPKNGHAAAAIRKSGPEIGNHCRAIVPASRMGPPTEGRCRYDDASDSNFRRRKVEQFRLQRHRAGK